MLSVLDPHMYKTNFKIHPLFSVHANEKETVVTTEETWR